MRLRDYLETIDYCDKLMLQMKQGLDPNGGSTVLGVNLIFFLVTPCRAVTTVNIAATVL